MFQKNKCRCLRGSRHGIFVVFKRELGWKLHTLYIEERSLMLNSERYAAFLLLFL